ncbi:MAG: band 7 protein [Actinomycetia bacterium]|nr:band 7 protein [Actinomycetes bacterium]
MPAKSSSPARGRFRFVPGRRGGIIAAVAVVIVALVTLPNLFGGFDRTTGGEVAVVRNGGVFDNNRIRQIIDPGSSLTWIGWASKSHKYPAQQRFYTITSDQKRGDRVGVDVVTVPSSDGVNMGIEGTLYFSLNTDHETLKQFDDKFGTRKFSGADGKARYAWEGDDGWSAFLDQIIRPVIDNDLRTQVNSFRCAELVSSCALVQNASAQLAAQQKPVAGQVQNNNGNIAKVQGAINTSLEQDLLQTLGAKFLSNLHFNLSRVTLPVSVQSAVDRAQAAFASVSEAQAKVAQARAEAAANKARQDGYTKCPTCAKIEELKALPQGITVYAPGNSGGIAIPTK